MKIFRALATVGLLLSLTAAKDASGWEEVSTFPQGKIYRRELPGTSVVGMEARGVMKAPPWAVRQVVLAPSKYEGVMRGLAEEKVLGYENCEPGAEAMPGCKIQFVYNRLSLPVVSERDYTIRVEIDQDDLLQGGEFRQSWSVATDKGPTPKKGVVRIRVNNGGWVLKPDGTGTSFTYTVATDPGGSIPNWATNIANNREMPRMIEAVEKAAQNLAAEAAKKDAAAPAADKNVAIPAKATVGSSK